MRTLAVCALLGCCVLGALGADEKPPWKVVVLVTDATMQGQVQRIDNAFHIRNERGTSVVPASQVLKVLDNLEEAYGFLRTRANLRDPDEHCRLARWCRSVGLETEARIEVEVALALRADHSEALQLRNVLQQVRTKLSSQTSPPAKPSTAAPKRDASSKPGVLVTLEGWDHAMSGPAFAEYTRNIQPILMNGCGNGACHGNDKTAGGFQLRKPYGAGNTTPYLTRQNLVQTLALIDKKEPERSALLKKALEPHGGGMKPPLGGKEAPAYRQLEEWLAKVAPSTGRTEDVFANKNEERPLRNERTKQESEAGFATNHTPGTKAQDAQVVPAGNVTPPKPESPGMGDNGPRRDAFGGPLDNPRPPVAEPVKPKSPRPSWLPARLFGAPKEPPPHVGATTDLPAWAAEPPVPSHDPYDPQPFNHHFHGRKEK
jgi:hypothetical protein